jgi:hypothetical protein
VHVQNIGGLTRVEFRSRGCLRVGIGVFLLVWLGAWTVGELVAVRGLLWMASREMVAHPMGWLAGGLLVAWTIAWTAVGAVTLVQLARVLFGVDRIDIATDRWSVFRGVGAIGRTRSFARSAIREVYQSLGNRQLMLETLDQRVELTSLATPEECRQFVERFWTPSAPPPSDALPIRWIGLHDVDGTLCIRSRRFDGPGCLVMVLVFALILAAFSVRFQITVTAIAAALLLALFLWGLFRREEWLARADFFARRVRWLQWSRMTEYDRHSLRIEEHVDNDGDRSFSLVALVRGKRKVVYFDLNEDRDVVGLARFLEHVTGWEVSRS